MLYSTNVNFNSTAVFFGGHLIIRFEFERRIFSLSLDIHDSLRESLVPATWHGTIECENETSTNLSEEIKPWKCGLCHDVSSSSYISSSSASNISFMSRCNNQNNKCDFILRRNSRSCFDFHRRTRTRIRRFLLYKQCATGNLWHVTLPSEPPSSLGNVQRRRSM